MRRGTEPRLFLRLRRTTGGHPPRPPAARDSRPGRPPDVPHRVGRHQPLMGQNGTRWVEELRLGFSLRALLLIYPKPGSGVDSRSRPCSCPSPLLRKQAPQRQTASGQLDGVGCRGGRQAVSRYVVHLQVLPPSPELAPARRCCEAVSEGGTNRGRSRRQLLSVGCVHEGGGTRDGHASQVVFEHPRADLEQEVGRTSRKPSPPASSADHRRSPDPPRSASHGLFRSPE
jgi:hypothetical protein